MFTCAPVSGFESFLTSRRGINDSSVAPVPSDRGRPLSLLPTCPQTPCHHAQTDSTTNMSSSSDYPRACITPPPAVATSPVEAEHAGTPNFGTSPFEAEHVGTPPDFGASPFFEAEHAGVSPHGSPVFGTSPTGAGRSGPHVSPPPVKLSDETPSVHRPSKRVCLSKPAEAVCKSDDDVEGKEDNEDVLPSASTVGGEHGAVVNE